MDWIGFQKKALGAVKQYRFAILVLIVGLALMLIPGKREETQSQVSIQAEKQESSDMSEELAQILSHIQGAGKVEVMLTVAYGEKTIYQTDEDISGVENGSTRIETVIITSSDRGQNGLIQQVNPPVYLGAIVVCQGADRSAVRLAIVEAVSKVTGLGADRISVLKMK
ncbi:MAG: hypothetical protein IJF02_03665 [Oscillospiraceae bacterium]|nr:hypothetical protein [Oscillospiraceae bacterium]